MKKTLFCVAALCAATLVQAAPSATGLIAKARAALGDEKSLTAVRTLHIEMSAADGEGKPLGSLISEYKAPMKQRELDYTQDKLEILTAIDGNEGHRLLRNMADGRRQLIILPAEEVNARRDFACANLYLLAEPSAERGSVSVAKDETIDGKTCAVLDYAYKSGITLRRYIDAATGRLVASRIDQKNKPGELMLNEGEQTVSGIKYPKLIVIRDAAGKTLRRLTLTKIEVNGDIADSSFVTPLY